MFMLQKCEACTPANPLCTLQDLVTALNQPVVPDDRQVVRNADGRLLPLTASEEKSLGIGYLPPHTGPIEGTSPLLGSASHCPYHLTISQKA
jgi:hypothetical protein